MKKNWPEIIEGRVATKNQKGFMITEIGGVSPIFINDCKSLTGTVLDVGCAYGVVTLPVLEQSRCQVIGFDLEKEHLDILEQAADGNCKNRLQTIVGFFPNDLHLEQNSIAAIHSSYMFHFLTGKDTTIGLKKCFDILKPGGKLCINTCSVYFNVLDRFIATYEKNVKNGSQWPGEIENVKMYLPEQDLTEAPEFFHVYKLEDFKNQVEAAGFVVDEAFYYDIIKPCWFESGGKGMIAIIATKPKM